MAEKKYRISKVAAEINVSWKSLIEHLNKNGFEVDVSMRAKINGDMYNELLRVYAKDKLAKEESKALELNIRKQNETLTAKTKKPSVTRKKETEENIVLIKDLGFSRGSKEEEEKSNPVDKSKIKKEKDEKPTDKKVDLPGLKVIGKLDLNKEKQENKSEPKKVDNEETKPKDKKIIEIKPAEVKTKEKVEKKSKEVITPKIEIKTEDTSIKDIPAKPEEKEKSPEKKREEKEPAREKETIKNDKPKKEEKTEDSPKKEPSPKEIIEQKEAENKRKEEQKDQKPEEEGLLKTKYSKLGGLTIKGKIDLPSPPKPKSRKPVASSQGRPGDKDKKKRKRRIKPNSGSSSGGNKRPFVKRSNNKRPEPREITEKEIQDKIKATLAKLGRGGKSSGKGGSRSKLRRQKRDDHKQNREDAILKEEESNKILNVTEFVTANELANLMDVGINDIITACFSLDIMVSINQRLDAETIQIVAEDFGFEVVFVGAEEQVEFEDIPDDPKDLKERPPIVTVMGHVDHGKTSLLDRIRDENVIAGEAGGITQHVAAYEVKLKNNKLITFVDTPGHEAFTAMRARGAKVTDVVIIVIAADDRVMPQTKEAISHAQAAGVPIVFALNKMDREEANADRIREELSAMNILVEEWGGKYQCQEISAKKGTNIDELLEKVLLEAELLELKANPNKRAKGTVMEARLDKGRGVLAALIVQEGTLQVGEPLVAGQHFCRVKAMFNERGISVKQADPSTPVSVLGFSSAPTAGDVFQVFETEQEAKEMSTKRSQLQREQNIRATKRITLEDIGKRLAVGNFKELKIIIKADVDGSAEALADALIKLSTDEILVSVIHKSVGQISEADVSLAAASDAVIIGFQVRPSANARKSAEKEGIDIRLYSVIYRAIDEIKSSMEGMLAPTFKEEITGNAEIREVFKITKVGTIAGCMIIDGKIYRDSGVRLIREGRVIYTGELASLKRFKDDVKEVNKGYECGMQIKNYNDLQEGDIIECYREVEIARKLK